MNTQKLVDEVVKQLEQLSDLKRDEMAQKKYPTSMIVKGGTIPNSRPKSKELRKNFKNTSPEEGISLAKNLNASRILKAQQIALEVIDKNKAVEYCIILEDLACSRRRDR